jgi:hypothetical protein
VPAADARAPEQRALRLLRSALLERLPLKAVAIFFAFVLWLAVSADEPGEQTVAVRLALRTDSALTLTGPAARVTATLTGRRRDLLKVRAGDLVLRRTIAGAGADSVRLVLRPGDVELPPGTEVEVRVRDVQPRQLTLRFAHRDPTRAATPPPRARAAGPARPAAAVPAPTLPEPLDTAAAAATVEHAPDTLWQAGGPDSAAAPGDTARGAAPGVIVLPSDSPAVVDSLPARGRPRRRGAPAAGPESPR